jgi:hypothetical protein
VQAIILHLQAVVDELKQPKGCVVCVNPARARAHRQQGASMPESGYDVDNDRSTWIHAHLQLIPLPDNKSLWILHWNHLATDRFTVSKAAKFQAQMMSKSELISTDPTLQRVVSDGSMHCNVVDTEDNDSADSSYAVPEQPSGTSVTAVVRLAPTDAQTVSSTAATANAGGNWASKRALFAAIDATSPATEKAAQQEIAVGDSRSTPGSTAPNTPTPASLEHPYHGYPDNQQLSDKLPLQRILPLPPASTTLHLAKTSRSPPPAPALQGDSRNGYVELWPLLDNH